MPSFEKHIFICHNTRDNPTKACCGPKNGLEIQQKMKEKLKQLGLHQRFRANKSGCLDACQHGVTAVIYPQGIWYGNVTAKDVDEIIEKSLVGNEVIERLQIKS